MHQHLDGQHLSGVSLEYALLPLSFLYIAHDYTSAGLAARKRE